jgi:hypothetical protein
MGIATPLIHVNRGMAARRPARITKGIAGTAETAYFEGDKPAGPRRGV